MKSVLCVALLALAAAEQSDNSYGYEAPAEEQFEEYQTQAQAEPEVAAPTMCVSCDAHAPCWTGESCVGFEEVEAAAYSTTAAPQSRTCPCGSVDTRFYSVRNTIVFWVAFGLLFLPCVVFFFSGFFRVKPAGDDDHVNWSMINIACGIVSCVASLSYLTMALGYGFTTRCNGRDLYYVRYIDWAITTPVMVWTYIQLAHKKDGLTATFMMVLALFMIIAGLIGELVHGGERWFFFGFAVLVFIPIKFVHCTLMGAAIVDVGHNAAELKLMNVLKSLYRLIVILATFNWGLYPIFWILANVTSKTAQCSTSYGAAAVAPIIRTGVISVQGEAIAYAVLDILAKSATGFILVTSSIATAEVQPRSMGGNRGMGGKKTSGSKKAPPAPKSHV